MAPDLMIPSDLSFEFKIKDEDWKELCSSIGVEKIPAYIDGLNDDSFDAMVYGICSYDNEKERKYMKNEVLELWYKRKKYNIIKKYDEMEKEFVKNRYDIVESFNTLVEEFNTSLDDLYNLDKATEQFVLIENAPNNVAKYKIDYDKLSDEFAREFNSKRNEELDKIKFKYEEVKAQLSLSDNLDYQLDVLSKYGILTKKDRKISE